VIVFAEEIIVKADFGDRNYGKLNARNGMSRFFAQKTPSSRPSLQHQTPSTSAMRGQTSARPLTTCIQPDPVSLLPNPPLRF
jgi:hypothetical protein